MQLYSKCRFACTDTCTVYGHCESKSGLAGGLGVCTCDVNRFELDGRLSFVVEDSERTCATTSRALEPGVFALFVAAVILMCVIVAVTSGIGLALLVRQQKARFNLQTLAIALLGLDGFTRMIFTLTTYGFDAIPSIPVTNLVNMLPDTFSNVVSVCCHSSSQCARLIPTHTHDPW